jgi:carbonic anhydrase/acetyltransferase-like protein (isoleucine patch superfamily)
MIVSFNGKTPRLAPTAFVHPLAYVCGEVTLADHVTVMPFASIRGEFAAITIGPYSNVQDNASVHADPDQPIVIGARVAIGHNAVFHGRRCGDHTLIGMGAVVVQGCEVGSWCLIGAGAVLPQGMQVPDRSLVLGVPATVRPLTEAQAARLEHNGQRYVALGAQYRAGAARVLE